jgi:hypothetical protein
MRGENKLGRCGKDERKASNQFAGANGGHVDFEIKF